MAGAAGEPLPAPLLGGTGVARVDLDVGGMGCEACQLYVQNAIASAPGVLRCTADWRKGTATVWMQNEELTDTGAAAPIPLNVSMLSETFAKGEYTLRLASKPEQAPEKTPPSAARVLVYLVKHEVNDVFDLLLLSAAGQPLPADLLDLN